MARKNEWRPLSLAQHFEAPDDYVGEFGWVVGYSADAGFLNDAAERFMRRTEAVRAYEGRIRLALMLDPGNPQITPAEAPGVLHLPLRSANKPFRLLHAKVALLGFRHETSREMWRLRLIVSTGNWVRQTMEESLDLVWTVELDNEQVTAKPHDDVKQCCADFQAAWNLIDYVRGHFESGALNHSPQDEAHKQLQAWVATIPFHEDFPHPRVFDNRERSLLDALPGMVKVHAGQTSRNHLSMGSGFFEAPSDDKVPHVLDQIVNALSGNSLLTRRAKIALFVERDACQAVAGALKAINSRGWSVYTAGKPAYFGEGRRTLHAKFLFSANARSGSNNCASPWIYLGSGNLTGPGFAQRMSASGGNLEAGVVFSPTGLQWSADRDGPPSSVITNVLPVQWETEVKETAVLACGDDMPDRGDEFLAPPVACLKWADGESAQGGWLTVPEEANTQLFDVLDGDTPCMRHERRFHWPREQPRQVNVRWGESHCHHAWVPVSDMLGRLGGGKLPALDIMDAWLQLANFPLPPDEVPEIPGEIKCRDERGGSRSEVPQQARYPIRCLMELIESIADKQTAIVKSDWTGWLTRLQQTLSQMSECRVLHEFKELNVNPLSPLWQSSFRPEFAEGRETPEGCNYEAVLASIEQKWGVGEMPRLGADQ